MVNKIWIIIPNVALSPLLPHRLPSNLSSPLPRWSSLWTLRAKTRRAHWQVYLTASTSYWLRTHTCHHMNVTTGCDLLWSAEWRKIWKLIIKQVMCHIFFRMSSYQLCMSCDARLLRGTWHTIRLRGNGNAEHNPYCWLQAHKTGVSHIRITSEYLGICQSCLATTARHTKCVPRKSESNQKHSSSRKLIPKAR